MLVIHRLSKIQLILYVMLAFQLLFGCVYAKESGVGEDKPLHHIGEGFQNPFVEKNKRGFFKYLKMRYFSNEEFADYESNAHKIPRIDPDLAAIRNPPDALQVTWIGHATILIQYKGINILTDPMFSDRASPVGFLGPKRHNPPALLIEDLPDIDYIVISHSHYDHLDQKLQSLGAQVKRVAQ